jgi:hypothetical protein
MCVVGAELVGRYKNLESRRRIAVGFLDPCEVHSSGAEDPGRLFLTGLHQSVRQSCGVDELNIEGHGSPSAVW